MTRTRLLARTFLARAFESDLLPPGLPQVQLLIWGAALAAAPGLLLSFRLGMAYEVLSADPAALARKLLVDRLIFITLSMTAMGLAALVLWPQVFPDRRDARQLGVLPLPGRVIVAARLLAMSALAGTILIGVNALPTLAFAPLVGVHGGAANVARGAFAHLAATGAAGAFVFLALLAVQGLLLNIAGRRWAERSALVLQVLFVVVILQQVLFLPRLGALVEADLRSIAGDGRLRWVPAFWFLGLYDVLGGRAAAGSAELAARGLAGLAAAAGLAVALLVGTHARLMRLAIEGREPGRRPAPGLRRLRGRVAHLMCRRPVARGVFTFTVRTLARSRSHRLLLAGYLGIAAAVIVVIVTPLLVRHGLAGLARPRLETLAVPLVLQFFTLTAMRLLVGIPVEPGANWVVRLVEPADRRAVLGGVRCAFLAVGVVPGALAGLIGAGVLWGGGAAVVHGVVCALAGALGTELLLFRFRKIPCTCTFAPGRTGILLWPVYVVAFTTYCFTTAGIALSLLGSVRMLPVAAAAAGVLIVALRRAQARALAGPPGLIFEAEDPEALFGGFHLSEAMAARGVRPLPPG